MNKFNRRKFLGLTTLGIATLTTYGKNIELAMGVIPLKEEIFHFNIGKFSCINFNDGYHDYPVESFFDKVPLNQLQNELGLSEVPETVTSTYGCLYIDTGENKLLIDSGVGKFFETTGRLQEYLQRENIQNKSIDTIIITHAHPDHIGGLLDNEGNLMFPNARFYSNQEEWDFFTKNDAYKKFKEDNIDFFNRLSGPALRIYEGIKNKLIYIEPDVEIMPGIKTIDAKGHTPGQIAVIVSSSDEKLIYISDVVFHPLHLKHLDWLPHQRYMVNPIEYKKTRRRIFDLAADENMLVSAMHFFPPPSLGHVKRKGDGWEWRPIT